MDQLHTDHAKNSWAPSAVVLLLLALPATTVAAPATLVVHGLLRTAGGGPAADGKYAVTTRIYASEKAAKPVWEETLLGVMVKSGAFRYVLGRNKPLDAKLLAGLAKPFIGIALDADPELSRWPVHAVLYSLHATTAARATRAATAAVAEKLSCSGCVDGSHIKGNTIRPAAVNFTYAGSSIKGGPAAKALDLQCSGCVSVQELAFDANLDLKGHSLSAATVTAKKVAASRVTASSFVGDGSQLTGIQTVSGTCKAEGSVVKGIRPDGSLICVPAVDAAALPGDGLDEVSNGQLTVEFVDTAAGKAGLAIPDNAPDGVTDEVLVGDHGVARDLTVDIRIKNSDASKIKVLLFDSLATPPASVAKADLSLVKNFLLYDGAKPKGSDITLHFSSKSKLLKGDLGKWVGHNPKGKWQLVVIDSAKGTGATDGAILAWSVSVHTLSHEKVRANGLLIASGGVDFRSSANKGFRFEVAASAPVKCGPATIGYVYYDSKRATLYICDGQGFEPISRVTSGTTRQTAGRSCKDLLDSGVTKDGPYWINGTPSDPSKAVQRQCDMTGGGWTLMVRENTAAGGWSSGRLTSATVGGKAVKVHGMWGAGGTSTKTFDLGAIPHGQVRFAGRYYAIDSWDHESNGAQLHVDGKLVWSKRKSYSSAGEGPGWVAVSFSPAPWPGGSQDGYWDLGKSVPPVVHTAGSVKVRFACGLDQGVADESFGFSHFALWVR